MVSLFKANIMMIGTQFSGLDIYYNLLQYMPRGPSLQEGKLYFGLAFIVSKLAAVLSFDVVHHA